MANIFLISDTHFHHENILKFLGEDGKPFRVFKDASHMDEVMVERWNSVVRPCDKVYHLGDVTMHKQLNGVFLRRLNGHKRLVRGNHDVAPTKQYLQYFDEVYGSRILDKMILTHIPISEESLGRFRGNVHGHIHQRRLMDPRYVNVSVERIDYTPIPLEEVSLMLDKQLHDTNHY